MKVNLNDRVRFRVKRRGLRVWRDLWSSIGVDAPSPIPDEMPLWEFAATFGPEMEMGFDPPVETEIEILTGEPYPAPPHSFGPAASFVAVR